MSNNKMSVKTSQVKEGITTEVTTTTITRCTPAAGDQEATATPTKEIAETTQAVNRQAINPGNGNINLGDYLLGSRTGSRFLRI